MSHQVFYIKTGDTAPSVEAILKIDNVPIDLTDATALRFKMSNGLDEVAVIVDAEAGSVRYDWGSGQTSTAGVYDAEFEITWTGGGIQTVPSKGYMKIYVAEDLDA
jgi:hypothetical protein